MTHEIDGEDDSDSSTDSNLHTGPASIDLQNVRSKVSKLPSSDDHVKNPQLPTGMSDDDLLADRTRICKLTSVHCSNTIGAFANTIHMQSLSVDTIIMDRPGLTCLDLFVGGCSCVVAAMTVPQIAVHD